MKRLTIGLAVVFLAGPANAGEIISGKVNVLDSTTMMVGNTKVELGFIVSLKPGNKCTWKNRPLDCGVLATAGLKDLVAGADLITCKGTSTGKFTCTAGGYDLAYGLIHAGWAVPTSKAPARYVTKMQQAKQRKLGFWATTNSSNEIIATTLTRR